MIINKEIRFNICNNLFRIGNQEIEIVGMIREKEEQEEQEEDMKSKK